MKQNRNLETTSWKSLIVCLHFQIEHYYNVVSLVVLNLLRACTRCPLELILIVLRLVNATRCFHFLSLTLCLEWALTVSARPENGALHSGLDRVWHVIWLGFLSRGGGGGGPEVVEKMIFFKLSTCGSESNSHTRRHKGGFWMTVYLHLETCEKEPKNSKRSS